MPGNTKQKDVMEEIMGSMGWYHCVIVLSVFAVKFNIAWHLISHGIMVPKHTPIYCNNTELENSGKLTDDDMKALLEEACDDACPQIVMSNKYYDRTIVSEYKLYCGYRKYLTTLSQTIVMLGVLIGNIVLGIVTDKFGRKIPFIICSVLQAPTGVLVAFCPNVWLFFLAKFVLNFFVGGSMCTGFVLFTELIGINWRSPMGLLFHIPFVLGYTLLSVFAYYLKDWRYFQICISAPSIIYIYFYWVLPESPRWLFITGKKEKCIAVLTRVARAHKRPTENISQLIDAEYEKNKNVNLGKGNLADVFSTKYMTFLTLINWANWFGVSTSFYGAAQYISSIGANLYISYAANALIQIPGVLFVIILFQFWGRKYPMVLAFLVPGCSFLVLIFIENSTGKMICATVAMFGLSMAFPGCYVYSSEVFPTIVRNIGVGSSSMLGRIGGVLAALIADASDQKKWIPSLMFTIVCLIVAFLDLFMPETKGIKLPDTLEEVSELRKNQKNIFRRKRNTENEENN